MSFTDYSFVVHFLLRSLFLSPVSHGHFFLTINNPPGLNRKEGKLFTKKQVCQVEELQMFSRKVYHLALSLDLVGLAKINTEMWTD